MNKFTNDTWLKDSNRRLRKKSKFPFGLILLVCLMTLTTLFIGSKLTSNNKTEQNDTYTPQKHIALLNSKEAIVWEEEDGSFSARIQYEFCKPLSFIDDCRWDRKIIEVKWSK